MVTLSEIELANFRCFAQKRLAFEGEKTLIRGANGMGKTSLLEAVCVLLRLQSPRTSKMNDVLRVPDEADVGGDVHRTWVRGVVRAGDAEAKALAWEGTLERKEGSERNGNKAQPRARFKRTLWCEGVKQSSAREYLKGSGKLVWFGNRDLQILLGPGEERRKYLDFVASQIDASHSAVRQSFERVLKQRNTYLRNSDVVSKSYLEALNKTLIDFSAELSLRRLEVLGQLRVLVHESLQLLSGQKERVKMRFFSKLEHVKCFADEVDFFTSKEKMKAMLEEQFEKKFSSEVGAKRTLIGAHRDDFLLLVNEMEAQTFCSEGQQRALVLALKIAQIRLLNEVSLHQELNQPVVLVDDVFGELDKKRREAFFELLDSDFSENQTLITTTFVDWLETSQRSKFSEVDLTD